MKRERLSPGLSSWCTLLLIVVGFALSASPAAAQVLGTATMQGTVTDESGAGMPGVTVAARSPASRCRI